ncbi:MAG: site-specific integrase, partial [Pseudomonadota bacterium]
FLALTGARRGEALGLDWDMIDGPRAVLPDSKTGPRTIWLGAPARALLATLPRTSSPRVFPGQNARTAKTLTTVWHRVRARAGLAGVRLHDLRHGFAATGVGQGEAARTIQGLLGHADLDTTLGYARLAEAPVAAAASRVGKRLSTALGQARQGQLREGQVRQGPLRKRKPTPLSARVRPSTPPPPSPKRARAASGGRASLFAATLLEREIEAFVRQSLTLTAYCAERGIDAEGFGQAVRAWRRTRRRETEERERRRADPATGTGSVADGRNAP